jgi:hypothetical protein
MAELRFTPPFLCILQEYFRIKFLLFGVFSILKKAYTIALHECGLSGGTGGGPD